MKLTAGLNRDVEPVDQPEGSWRKAMNMMIDQQGAITNEFGFTQVEWEANRIVIGTINIDTGVILFTVMYDADAETPLAKTPKIFLVRGENKYVIFQGDELDLSEERPVTGTYFRDTSNILNITYTDSKHIRLLKVTNEESLNILPTELNLFPTIPIPLGTLIDVETGGSLQSGVYQFVFALELQDGTITHYMNPTNWIHVIDSPMDYPYSEVDGCEAGKNSGKSITLDISNLSSNFKNLHIGVIKKVGGQLFPSSLKPIPITGATIKFSYSGGGERPVELSEFVVPYQSYSSAKSMTIHGDRLYLGNLTTNQVLKYQKFANNIAIKWFIGDAISLKEARGSYKDPRVAYFFKSFMPGEVYAFFIRFIMKDGTYSPAFHIPGRVGTSTERANASSALQDINGRAKNFHFTEYADSTGKMSYYENLDEEYPNSEEFDGSVDYDGVAISGGRNLLSEDGGVKHHKFPSTNFLQGLTSAARTITSDAGTSNYNLYNTTTASFYLGTLEHRIRFNTSTGYLDTNGYRITRPGGTNGGTFHTNFPETSVDDRGNVIHLISSSHNNLGFRLKMSAYVVIDTSNTGADPSSLLPHSTSSFQIVQQTSSTTFDVLYESSSWIPVGTNKFGLSIEADIIYQHTNDKPIYIRFAISLAGPESLVTKIPLNNSSDISIQSGSLTATFIRAYDEVGAAGDIFCKPLRARAENIVIPPEIADKIQGYELLAAERSLGNSTIIGQSALIPLKVDTINLPVTESARFHAFDMLYNKPDEKPTHISLQCNLAKIDTLAAGRITDTIVDVAALSSNYIQTSAANVTGGNLIRRITGVKYLPVDNSAVDVRGSTNGNRFREEAIEVRLDSDLAPAAGTELFLVDMNVFRANMYSSMFGQPLMKVSQAKLVGVGTHTANMYGDTYCSQYGIRLTINEGEAVNDEKEVLYNIVCFSMSNIGLRYEGDEWHEKYYPKSINADKKLWQYIPEGELNAAGTDVGPDGTDVNRRLYARKFSSHLAYNKDYSSIHNLFSTVIFNPNSIYADKFPYRVARSMFLNKEAQGNPFRLFQVLDYYEMPKNRGVITNLASLGPLLLIHHQYALYRTVGKEKIVTDSAEVYLGTGDPFERPPEELIPAAGGYAGTSAQQSCIVTKLGYFFVDNIQGRAFIVNDSIEEVSAKGLRGWFRDFGVENSDNPYISTGYVAGYDQLYNRIILRLHGSCAFTVSYSGDSGSWLSFHSYKPRFFAFYQNNLYSGEGSLAKHNNPHKRGVYYVNVAEESYIEVVFAGNGRSVLDSLLWHAECWNRGIVNRTETFSHVTIYNSYQLSGKVPLSYYSVTNGGNYRSYGNQFVFNGFRDMAPGNAQVYDAGDPNLSVVNTSKPWSERARFVDNYHIVRLYYDNPLAQYMNGIYLYSIQPNVRQRI